MAGRRRSRVDVLLAALDEYGMSASLVSATELIQERVQWVAAHLRVTPATARPQAIAGRHSTCDTVAGIAGPVVLAPPALLNRIARYLDAAAALVRTEGVLPGGFDPAHATQLADTFEADSVAARYYSDGA